MSVLFRLLLTVSSLYVCYGGNQTDDSLFTFDAILSDTWIPKQQTTYVCQQFKLPDDQPYHVVTFEPIVNNTNILHHMLLFGCEFELDVQGPHTCDSLDQRCRSWMVKWDTGMSGPQDMPPEAGVRVGQGSFRYLLLQMHWNNADSKEHIHDGSGFRLHYTNKLRANDIGNVQIGQNAVIIPPGSPSVTVSGVCPSRCTGIMLPHEIHLSTVYMHMHALGFRATLDIRQEREIVERLTRDEDYNFTQPLLHTFLPARSVYPGDELRLTCWYNSLTGSRHRNRTVRFGPGSESEMCYAFIRYYPRILGFEQCIQSGETTLNC